MYLNNGIFIKMVLHLQNRRPKDRSRPRSGVGPKRGVRIIFSLKHLRGNDFSVIIFPAV
jgi:hypothetical protein